MMRFAAVKPQRFLGQNVGAVRSAKPGIRPMGTGEQRCGLRKDGQKLAADISLSRRLAEHRLAIASALREVAEHKRLEEELRQRTLQLEDADRHKDEFLGMVGHELRSPLAAIRNTVQVLRQLGSSDPNLQWARDAIDRQAQHMAQLVEDLLDVSRIAHGKVRIRKEPVELGQVVRQAVETAQSLLNARQQQLTVSLPSWPVRLQADPIRLVQVFTNLLNNAAKYTDEGGQIWLAAEEKEGEVVVQVRDTGIGIAAEMLPHVFELFTQVPGALDRAQGGLGIGLAMVGQLVQLHGGTVQAFSDGPGRGSDFVVRLPLLRPTHLAADRLAAADHSSADSPSRRVLVVDDNEDLVEAAVRLLRRRGHHVHAAGDGAVALVTAQTFRPEVVFLDIGLPGQSGYEVARSLRQQPGLENVLLVATTGRAEEEVRIRAEEAGFDVYLVKPFPVDAMLRLVAHRRCGALGRRMQSCA
jgi:signal transduction histidine kinase/CheY-like chemotaxis protein